MAAAMRVDLRTRVIRPDGSVLIVRAGCADLYRGFPGYRVPRRR